MGRHALGRCRDSDAFSIEYEIKSNLGLIHMSVVPMPEGVVLRSNAQREVHRSAKQPPWYFFDDLSCVFVTNKSVWLRPLQDWRLSFGFN